MISLLPFFRPVFVNGGTPRVREHARYTKEVCNGAHSQFFLQGLGFSYGIPGRERGVSWMGFIRLEPSSLDMIISGEGLTFGVEQDPARNGIFIFAF